MKTTFAHVRTSSFTLLASLLLACITACGATAPAISQPEPVPSVPPSLPTTENPLRIWIATNKSTVEIQALLEQVCEKNGLEVEFSAANPDLVLPALQDANPPDLILLSTNAPVAFYASSGLLLDLTTFIDQDILFPAMVDTCSLDGQLFCLPWGANFQVLLLNKGLFNASNLDPESPPASLEQLTDIADVLTKFGPEGQLEQLGFLPILSTWQTSLFVRMFGGYWVNENGQHITADNPAVLEALQWEQQFYYKYNYENVSSLFPFSVSLDSSENPFYTQKVAIVVAEWDQASPEFISQRNPNLEYGIAPIPSSSTANAGKNLLLVDGAVVLVPARTANVMEVATLLQAISAPEVLAEVAVLLGQLPTNPVAFKDARFQADQNTALFTSILQNSEGVTALTTPLSPELESAILQIGELTFYQGADPAPLLDQVQSEFEPLLQQIILP
jgi:ABC-type glycerol-3-phosphate transport system substrate-binding protein